MLKGETDLENCDLRVPFPRFWHAASKARFLPLVPHRNWFYILRIVTSEIEVVFLMSDETSENWDEAQPHYVLSSHLNSKAAHVMLKTDARLPKFFAIGICKKDGQGGSWRQQLFGWYGNAELRDGYVVLNYTSSSWAFRLVLSHTFSAWERRVRYPSWDITGCATRWRIWHDALGSVGRNL